jgi:putative DNA primase/helicase
VTDEPTGDPLERLGRLRPAEGPRPLYGLDRLARRPGARVLIVEDEKAADAALERFPELVAVSCPGGFKQAHLADWSVIARRESVIWPAADKSKEGQKASEAVARRAKKAGATSAAVVAIPEGLPDKWGLADPWPAGFELEQAKAAIEDAFAAEFPRLSEPPRAVAPEPDAAGVTWPAGFEMVTAGRLKDLGLWCYVGEGDKRHRVWLSDPFEVLGQARDTNGRGWSVVVRFKAQDGREVTLPILRASLASGGNDARTMLADAGLTFNNGQGLRERFANALFRVRGPGFVTLAASTGWLDGRFVLPERIIGPADGPIMFTGDANALKYGQGGTLERWQREVAQKAVGNSLLMVALSAGFAAPLLRLLEVEGGGLHFKGNSSSGKSTLLTAAGSIWGGDRNLGQLGFCHPWRSTPGALEGLAMAHNDGLLCLDEIGQLDPFEAGEAVYMLANGAGKTRLKPDISIRPSAKWVLLYLSSGEKGLSEHIAAGRRPGQAAPRAAAGQELRFLDIVADVGKGIWERLDDGEAPAARSDALKAAAKAHYGHAGPLFLEGLLANRDALLQDAHETMRGFLTKALRPDDSGQIRRAAQRFAVAAAGGELAAGLGVVPWELGAATKAALAVFERWAKVFGRAGLHEQREVIARIAGFIETNHSQFGVVGTEIDEEAPLGGLVDIRPGVEPGEHGLRSLVRAGFVQQRKGVKYYNFTVRGFEVALEGYPSSQAANFLWDAGYLDKDTEKDRWTKKVWHGGQRINYYSVKASILEHDDD